MSEQSCKIRIGTDGTDVQSQWLLHYWHLPKPDLSIYQDHTTKTSLGDGGQALRGRKSVTLAWNQLTDVQFQRLYTAFTAAAGTIWLTIDKGWGETSALTGWIDVSGIPHRPTGTPVQQAGGVVVEDVRFHIANVTVQVDPAAGI